MRADLFLHPKSQYAALDHFTLKLGEAFERAGVTVKIHPLENKDPRPFLNSLERDPPDFTLSFNGILPDKEGHFLCDMIGIPHIACLVDSPPWFLPLKDSPLTYIACPDRSHVDFFRGLGLEDKRVSFMTQACDRDLRPSGTKKIYDVSFLCSCIDIEAIEAAWRKTYSEKMVRCLLHAADVALKDPAIPYWEAFTDAMSAHKPEDLLEWVDFVEILKELERYLNGKDRIELLKHLTGVTIDVFGDQGGQGSWSHYLKGFSHLRLHPPVPFTEHFAILESSRVTLNSLAKIRQGGSERVFNALALGCIPLSSESAYLAEYYEDQKSILYYHSGSWKAAQDKILQVLNNKVYADEVAAKGREITLKTQTWDHRARDLLAQN